MSAPSAFPVGKVLIVGGGNAAHAMAALFPSRGIETNMLANFADEAERINASLEQHGSITATFDAHCTPSGIVQGRPAIVSKHAAEVMDGVNVILLPLPSFAYKSTLEALKPFLKPGMHIGVTPGQGGFDWLARNVLGDLASEIVFFALLPMPFNCRITEFGKAVAVTEFKQHYRIATTPSDKAADAISICQQLFGESEDIGHFLSATLYPVNAVIHPQRLWALCHPKGRAPYSEELPLLENPLFYEQMDELSTEMMSQVNAELCHVADSFKAQGVAVGVPSLLDFLAKFVYRDPAPDLRTFFATQQAYKGFRCPFVQTEDGKGWAPDFKNRYFTEDIPFGLAIYKGVADIVDVPTPTIDLVLEWAQKGMGKEYVVDGKLTGKHVGETGAPQRWGITTVEGLERGY
jgi:hypothetical protein